MNKRQLTQILGDLGLSENESQVYLAALGLGPTTIMRIAQAAEIRRTTAYSVIDSLQQKGLITIQVHGFKKKFAAEDPQRLETILDTRRKKLHDALPEFSALYNLQGGESFIKYYSGIEAVKNVYESLIRDIKPHQDYLVMANQDQWLNLDKDYFLDFLHRRAKLPINIRMMFQETPLGREWQQQEKNFNSRIKILPKDTRLKTNLVITPQRVVIHQLSQPVMAMVIENKSIIQMHKEMFEIIWNSLPN